MERASPSGPPANEDWDRSGLLAFFRGSGRDSEGRRLAQLREMDFECMEMMHDYIQWMFPTDEPSMFNESAPILTAQHQRAFAESPELKEELRLNLARFCEFLGLELRGGRGAKVEVVVAPTFKQRIMVCWTPMYGRNHNWLRISRVLMCLGRCSLFDEQKAFHACLEKLHKDGVPCASAMPHWRERAQTAPAFEKSA